MTKDEAVKILEPYTGPEYQGIKIQDACEVAVSSLRAQKAPAKLDRSRWEGCERCNEDWDLDDTELWMYGEQGEVRIVGDEMSCNVGLFWTTEKIKFCPYCGKPLAEEAWAELERRINDGTTDVLEQRI